MIIDFEGTSLEDLCDGFYIDAQVCIEYHSEGGDEKWNDYTSIYVDGDIYIHTPDGTIKAEGKFGEYLESLLIDKAKQRL